MSLTPEEQRALAFSCGFYQGRRLDEIEQYFTVYNIALADYTAAVEAKRDEEVAALKSDVAVRDEYVEELRVRERELTRKLEEQQAVNKKLLPKYGGVGTRDVDVTMARAAYNNASSELTALLAQERERCAVFCDPTNADDPSDWTEYAKIRAKCAEEIRSLK